MGIPYGHRIPDILKCNNPLTNKLFNNKMKKVLVFCIAALAVVAVSCQKKDGGSNIDWSKVTVDGFYVAGPATGSAEIKPECVMAAGFNEVDKAPREGMFEKYIVLEGGKDFYLAYSDGGKLTYYSATLAEFITPEEEAYAENPDKVIKGKLIVGDSPVAMKVEKTGLYHIVLDTNKLGDLKEAQILLLDASQFGLRGGMNSWGFTAGAPESFSNEGTVFAFKDQELAAGGSFKFSTHSFWKVTLDDAGKVKAEISLGETGNGLGLANYPGRKDNNIIVEKGGKYDITLTFKLAQGDFSKSFTYTVVCTEESKAPTTMYMNGGQWGGTNWDWASDGIVELVPIHGAAGEFWCTRWFDHTQEFKFCAQKAWNGDFGIDGQNCKVDADGFYTIYVNGNNNTVEINPAAIYGLGACFGNNDWAAEDAYKAVADGQVMKLTTTAGGELRIAAKVKDYDFWKTEFIFFDGKIAYRGAGDDQERVQGEAGKTITLDFNNGTATMQ